MSVAVAAVAFAAGAVISLAVSWLPVTRLKRVLPGVSTAAVLQELAWAVGRPGSTWACPGPCSAWWRRSGRTRPG